MSGQEGFLAALGVTARNADAVEQQVIEEVRQGGRQGAEQPRGPRAVPLQRAQAHLGAPQRPFTHLQRASIAPQAIQQEQRGEQEPGAGASRPAGGQPAGLERRAALLRRAAPAPHRLQRSCSSRLKRHPHAARRRGGWRRPAAGVHR